LFLLLPFLEIRVVILVEVIEVEVRGGIQQERVLCAWLPVEALCVVQV
jgi:hypothetical protein